MTRKQSQADLHHALATPLARAGVLTLALFVAAMSLGPSGASADAAHEEDRAVDVSPSEDGEAQQTECPVMIGNKIDPDLYAIYQGKKVYFCCSSCKSAFENSPEKYLHRLPQFASVADAPHGDGEHEHGQTGLFLVRLIVPTGIATLSLVAATGLLAVLRRVKRFKARVVMRVHKIAGVSALVTGIMHAALIILLH